MKNVLMVAVLATFGLGAMGATAFSAGDDNRPVGHEVFDAELDVAADRAVDARLHVVLKTLIAEQRR